MAQEEKQVKKYKLNCLKTAKDEKELLFHIEQELVDDIVKKVLVAKNKIEVEENKNNTLVLSIKTFMVWMFIILGIILFVLFILFGCEVNAFPSIGLSLLYCLGSLVFSIICFVLAYDTYKEHDKNYLVSFFAAFVALCSLIVALLGYFKQIKP